MVFGEEGMKESRKVYLPSSDCECYYQALDLLNEALAPFIERLESLERGLPQYLGLSTETKPNDAPKNSIYLELDTGRFYYYDGNSWELMDCSCGSSGGGTVESEYIFLNEWLADNACAGYPETQIDLANLIDQGKKLLYFNVQDGNLYISNGQYEYNGLYPDIYFSIFHGCDDEENRDTGAYLGSEMQFISNGKLDNFMRTVPMNVNTTIDVPGFTPPEDAIGIIVGIEGQPITAKNVFYMFKSGYLPSVSYGGDNYATFYIDSLSNMAEFPFYLNGSPQLGNPYVKLYEHDSKLLLIVMPTPVEPS